MASPLAAMTQWWAAARPSGYRPGALLARLQQDLPDRTWRPLAIDRARFHARHLPIEFDVEERVEAHFLMHVVNADFRLRVQTPQARDGRLEIRHSGRWQRTGVHCVRRHDPSGMLLPITAQIEAHESLRAVLLPLDFTRCELTGDADGWEVRLTHFGACEVVHRMPATRQYVRLPATQAHLIENAFGLLTAILAPRE